MNRTTIFDTVRKMTGRGFRQGEVDRLDRTIDCVTGDDHACDEFLPAAPMAPGSQAFELIKRFEGCASLRPDGLVEADPDPGTGGAPWTIGWGATGPDIGPGTVWTQAQYDARLAIDVARHAAEVARTLGDAPTTQAQFDALTSFHYNTGAISRATLTARHLAGDTAERARNLPAGTGPEAAFLRGWCAGARPKRMSMPTADARCKGSHQ